MAPFLLKRGCFVISPIYLSEQTSNLSKIILSGGHNVVP